MTADTCGRCGSEGPHKTTLETTGVHYARLACDCGAFIRWIPKPDSDATKYRRPKAHLGLVEKYGAGFCEMCLRPVDTLPKGQTLEAQHVKEFQDEGSPERHNIWIVCTACHRMIGWLRTYHGALNG